MIEKIKSPGIQNRRYPDQRLGRELNVIFSESAFTGRIAFNMRGAILAFGFFIYFFVQNGTLGLFPEKWYIYYRSIRLSDLVLYVLIGYSFIKIREYEDLFKSKALIIPKIFLLYIIFEFLLSAISYHFDVIEYFFRLKGLWSSFLIFPFLLLIRRGGLPYLIKMIFPFAVISNILYIMTALTGVAFLPDVSIHIQKLPMDITVFRVYGGTFYGEMFLLGFIYFWLTKKFKLYQVFFAVLFIIPHILAFGRGAWVVLSFSIFSIFIMSAFYKKNYKSLFRQTIIVIILFASLIIVFMKFIPGSDYYLDALKARVIEGQDDITYSEGTYDTRIHFQNTALLKLWNQSDPFVGIGMHPMWVVRPENYEEQVWYNAFCDVTWPAVLAAYGLIGLAIALYFQFYFILKSSKIVFKPSGIDLLNFFMILGLARFVLDTFISFSFTLVSTTLWGFYASNFYIAVFVYCYEQYRNRKENVQKKETESNYIKLNGVYKKIKNDRFYTNNNNGLMNNGKK